MYLENTLFHCCHNVQLSVKFPSKYLGHKNQENSAALEQLIIATDSNKRYTSLLKTEAQSGHCKSDKKKNHTKTENTVHKSLTSANDMLFETQEAKIHCDSETNWSIKVSLE